MTSIEEIHDLANEWDSRLNQDGTQNNYRLLLNEINFLSILFEEYQPFAAQGTNWESRFASWISNAEGSKEEQRPVIQAMLRLIPELLFITKKDTESLQSILYDIVCKWLMDLNRINFSSLNELAPLIQHTYFTSVTDSFLLPEFLRRFGFQNHSNRLNWRDSTGGILRDINANNYKHIVIFEDFIGSGTQAISSCLDHIRDNCQHLFNDGIRLIICPSIIAPKGLKVLTDFSENLPHKILKVYSGWVLDKKYCLADFPKRNEIDIVNKLFSSKGSPSFNRVDANILKNGFGQLGLMFSQYSNCPDNTHPFIWWNEDNSKWHPLFPRIMREGF